MKTLVGALALLLLGGCSHPGYYYPGQVPRDCKVSDGYCFHRVIQDNQAWWDVYLWVPDRGWYLHHREAVR